MDCASSPEEVNEFHTTQSQSEGACGSHVRSKDQRHEESPFYFSNAINSMKHSSSGIKEKSTGSPKSIINNENSWPNFTSSVNSVTNLQASTGINLACPHPVISKQKDLTSFSLHSTSIFTNNITVAQPRENNLITPASENTSNCLKRMRSSSDFNGKSKEKCLALLTSSHDVAKHSHLFVGNNQAHPTSDSQFTEVEHPASLNESHAEIISVNIDGNILVTDSNPNKNQIEIPKSVDKSVSILKSVSNENNTQFISKKRTKTGKTPNSIEENSVKITSYSKPVQKKKLVYVLVQKKNDHHSSEKNITCSKSDIPSSCHSEFKKNKSSSDGSVTSGKNISSTVVTYKDTGLDVNLSNNCNSTKTLGGNTVVPCSYQSQDRLIGTEDFLNYTENVKKMSIPPSCAVVAKTTNICPSEETDQTIMHLDISEHAITKISVNHEKENNSNKLINSQRKHCAGNRETQSDTFGKTLTEPEGIDFVYGIKQIWLHSASEFTPNSQLPAGFWENKDAPVPQNILDALENW